MTWGAVATFLPARTPITLPSALNNSSSIGWCSIKVPPYTAHNLCIIECTSECHVALHLLCSSQQQNVVLRFTEQSLLRVRPGRTWGRDTGIHRGARVIRHRVLTPSASPYKVCKNHQNSISHGFRNSSPGQITDLSKKSSEFCNAMAWPTKLTVLASRPKLLKISAAVAVLTFLLSTTVESAFTFYDGNKSVLLTVTRKMLLP